MVKILLRTMVDTDFFTENHGRYRLVGDTILALGDLPSVGEIST